MGTVLRFSPKNPETAYLTNNLLLPRTKVNERAVREQLTFVIGEEFDVDPHTNEILGMKQKVMRLWDETAHHLVVPREYVPEDRRRRLRMPLIEERPLFEHVPFVHRIELRDRQKSAWDALRIPRWAGILNLACGLGKSVLALRLAAEVGWPTIIIVNSTALLEQWLDEIEKHLGIKRSMIGIIQGERADLDRPIIVAMLHTLALRRDEWPMSFRRSFGLAIYDEVHHLSAPVFVQAADLFFGRRLGLTATATRTDGLEAVYQYHLGSVFFTDLSQDLVPRVRFTVFHYQLTAEETAATKDVNHEVNVSKVRTMLGALDWRNRLICDDIEHDLRDGRTLLVLSHSKEHLERLCAELRQRGHSPGLIDGDTPQGARIPILRSHNPVIGTFQLAREALDRPDLDTLYVTTPFSNSNDLQQSVGRIQRLHGEKHEPLVRVYEDGPINSSVRACRKLRRFLRALQYPQTRTKIEVKR